VSQTRDPERDQQLPTPGRQPVQAALIRALAERRDYGTRKYGRPLETHNGRDALTDAWEEALDLLTYLTQMRLERGDQVAPDAGRELAGTCDASAVIDLGLANGPSTFGPCVLRRGHDGPVHKAADGTTWCPGTEAGPGSITIPLAAFDQLVKVAMHVSLGKSAAFHQDSPYPDVVARFGLGALHEAGLLDAYRQRHPDPLDGVPGAH
jgi:hypothetical protein